MTAAEVYLPCDVGHVKVKLGFGDTLSPLEEAALRVIAALSAADDPSEEADTVQRADIREVATLLGLGYRVALDLVHDLWRAGYLVVDFGSNSIGLSQDVQGKLADGELSTLRGTETEDSTVELMMERLTGYVMPTHGPFAPADPRLAVRFLGTDSGFAEASHADIYQAVRGWLRQERRGRQRRILSVRSAPGDRFTGGARRWYPLAVQAEVSPDSERLVVTVTDRRFPADRRDRASDRLTRLAEDKPLEPWVTQLRNTAEQRLVTPPSVEEIIDRLEARIASGMSIPAGRHHAEHLEWADESRRITGFIQDRIAHEVNAELVLSGEAHAATVSQLIDEARTQLVLACPRIVDYALEQFAAQLQGAIDRGVQVVILWGGEYKATLQGNVRNALDSLARRAKTATVLRAQVSANTNVRMVICDNRAALVTSRDFLTTTRERPEVGLLLRRPDGQDGAALSELLGWARVNMPGSMSTSVLRHADRFDGAKAASWDEPAERQREELPEELPEDLADTGAVQAWTMRWEAHLASLRAELAGRPLPSVRTVEDGAHRELLWQALRRAQRRVVIASGQLSDEVVNSRMIDAIGMLLARGVAVTVGYDEQGGADRGKGALAAFADLAETYPTLLTVSGGVGHTRALVWDDDVMVGSYSYLFHAGYGTVGGRHMLPSELSIRLTDAALADQVAAACGEPAEVTTRTTGTTAAPAEPAEDIDPAALAIVQRILNRAGDPRPGALVRVELRATDNPWPVLDLLNRLAYPAIRRAAIAYCLAHANPDVRTATRWRERLIADLASDGLFAEAEIVRAGTLEDLGPESSTAPPDGHGVPDSGRADTTRAPRPAVLAALSRHGQPGSEDVLLGAAIEEDLTADEQAALLAVSVGELLATGSTDAEDALEYLPDDDGPWGELARLALAYQRNAAGASTAELIREVSKQRRADTWLEGAWDRLELALIESEPLPMTLDGAKKTKAALFKDTGVLGRLRGIAARRDLPALRMLVTAEFPARPLPYDIAGDLLDRTWHEVAPQSDLLYGKPRAKYIKRLAEVVAAARDLATAGDSTATIAVDGTAGGGAWHPDLLAAASHFAEGYLRLRPILEETAALGPLVGAAGNGVLTALDRLMSGLSPEPEDEDPGADSGHGGPESAPVTAGPEAGAATWQGRWQYPELAAGLWAGETDPARVAALLLADLVEPLPPVQTGRRLVNAGEFAAVEALRNEAMLSATDAAGLTRELQNAQAMAVARARYEAAALTRRARRAELSITLDLDMVGDQAQQRRADAEQTLRDFSRQVTTGEDIVARELTEAVNAHPAVCAGKDEDTGADAETVDRWRRTVLACVAAREFPSARHVLSQRPGEAYIHDPRSYSAPRPVWPFPADIPEMVLSWYFPDGQGTPPRFDSWRPAEQDDAAWGLLEALRAHLRDPSTLSATILRDKLQWLVGGRHQLAPMTPGERSWTGRLYLQDNFRLPRLSVLGRDGIALWIGDSRTPPPDLDDAVIAWLVTDFDQPAPAPPGTTIIDLPFLFRLVAPHEGSTSDSETRLVNLVRHLGAQLDAARLTGDAQPSFKPFSESDVAWILDLLGAGSDGVVADALYYDTGGRCEVLVSLAGQLLPPPVPGLCRYHRLDVTMLNAAWDGGAWRANAVDALLAPLYGESAVLTAAVAIVWVVAAFHDGDFLLDDLKTGIRLAAETDKHAETFLRSADCGDAARQLLRVGIFQRAQGGRWRLVDNGIRELLSGVWPGHDPVARAREAIGVWFRHHERSVGQLRAELSDDVVRTIGHWIANRMAAARSARNRHDPELAWHIADAVDLVHDMYREALEAEEELAIWDVLSDCKNETEFLNPAFRVRLTVEADMPGVRVVANDWLLGHAFQNLFDNARQAFEITGRESGTVRVTVTVVAPSATAERMCRVDMEDDGPGFDAKALAKLAAGEEYSTRGGRGTGMKSARRWFEEYRGKLEIMNEASALGGAWVRVTLPMAAASAASGDWPADDDLGHDASS